VPYATGWGHDDAGGALRTFAERIDEIASHRGRALNPTDNLRERTIQMTNDDIIRAELDAYRAEGQAQRAEAAAFREETAARIDAVQAEVRAYRDEVIAWREHTDARLEAHERDIGVIVSRLMDGNEQ
jgi:hypothetical protein